MNKNISIINYGMGNIGSVENAIKTLNFKPKIIESPENVYGHPENLSGHPENPCRHPEPRQRHL